ncbi:MAG: hypothetical protein ACJA13_003244 [Paraglaciecola sp.]|jgi:hypothetical protein
MIKITYSDKENAMEVEQLTHVFGWCTAMDYSLLVIWFTMFIVAHDWIYSTHRKWFDLSIQQFDMLNYCGMGLFKMFIFVFNLVPYLALRLAA